MMSGRNNDHCISTRQKPHRDLKKGQNGSANIGGEPRRIGGNHFTVRYQFPPGTIAIYGGRIVEYCRVRN